MHIRPATLADLPRCQTINDAGFKGDELVNFLGPDRFKYALSWRHQGLVSQRNRYYNPNTWSIVCVADIDDSFASVGEVLGYARWTRHVAKDDVGGDLQSRRLSLLERANGWLCWAELKCQETLRINPAISWENTDAFRKAVAKSDTFAPIRGATHWYLEVLSVAPEYYRRGIGRKLTEWGVRRVEADTKEQIALGKRPVPAALIASATGVHLYRSLGFKVVGWGDDSFLGTPSAGGGSMVWDPSNYWLRDVEYEPPIRRGVVEAAFTTREAEDHSNPELAATSAARVL